MARSENKVERSERPVRRRIGHFQSLESRRVLAGDLVALWQADDLSASLDDGAHVAQWVDSISGIVATAAGNPLLDKGPAGGRAAVRLAEPADAFVVAAANNPLSGASDFSVSVAFRTTANDLAGTDGPWYTNAGLVDMNSRGVQQDFGLAINQAGQVSAGLGNGLAGPPATTIRTSRQGLNDGRLHVVTFTRQANVISLYVDRDTAIGGSDAGTEPRSSLALTLGALTTGNLGFMGELAEVRIFNGGLTDAEVQTVFDAVMAPRPQDDVYFVTPGQPLDVDQAAGVIGNDASYEPSDLTVAALSAPQHGTLTLNENGSFTYTPSEDFRAGTDTVRYRSTDGNGLSNDATITFVINSPADQASIVINELHVNPDIDTELVEFIELYNSGDVPVDLSGWYFGQGVEYSFPQAAMIAPHGYYVVTQDAAAFRQKFGLDADGQWIGRLSNEGETIELRTATATLVDRVDYGEGFPWPTVGESPGYSMELVNPPLDNQLGGSWRSSVGNQAVIGLQDTWSYFKGTAEPSLDAQAWRQPGFDDGQWLSGASPIGYSTRLAVNTPLDDMRRNYSTVYLRNKFQIDEAAAIQSLILRTFVDDGVNIWINGTPVASLNTAAADLAYDALATAANAATDAVDFVLSDAASYLVDGENVIAVQLLNESLSSSDAFFEATLLNPSLAAPGPTPGRANSVLSDSLGPQLRQVTHSPDQPQTGQPVTVTVRATDPDGVASVNLDYQVVRPGEYIRLTDSDYRTNWTTVPMHDDGAGGDAVAGDAIFTAVVPGDVNQHRHLVRYRIQATDSRGDAVSVPYADDPQPNFAYFVYDGVPAWTAAERPGTTDSVTFSKEAMNQLSVYHLIANADDVQRSQYVSSAEELRFRGTMVYDGQVYDHIEFGVRGEFSTYVSGKNKWKFFFNRGHEFQARDNYGRPYEATWRNMNFSSASTPWVLMNRGMAGIGEAIAYKLYDLAGNPSPNTNFLQFRVIDDASEAPADQYAGDLWGLYLTIEQPDGRFLDERNLPDGSVYKVENGAGDLKNQGPTQPDAARDFRDMMSQTSRAGTVEGWREVLDLDAYYTFRAVNREINNMDLRDGWNHYVYHNPETNRWTVIPWDLDMLYVPSTHWSGVIRFQNALRHDELEIEYMNRGRELQDLLFSTDQIGQLVDEYAGFVNPQTGGMTMVDVDQYMWNYNPRSASGHRGAFNRRVADYNFAQGPDGVRRMISGDHEGFAQWIKDFMTAPPGGGSDPASYGWDFLNREASDDAIPATPQISFVGQPSFPADGLVFATSDFSDPQGDGTFAALEWRLAEVTDVTAPSYDPQAPPHYEVRAVWESGELTEFQRQIEIPASAATPGHAYRVRVRVKDDTGRWSHWSEPVQFVATVGAPADLIAGLRISELHYNPSDPTTAEAAAGFTDNDDFEFIELTNVGTQPLDLSAVRLVESVVDGDAQGLEFDFAQGAIRVLEPGQRVVVVEDLAAFQARYGAGLPVAGQWQGQLSNGGEQLTLEAAGAVVQQFSYRDDWHAETDGGGPSLEVVNLNADAAVWNSAENWLPSLVPGGTPGRASPVPGDANHDGQFESTDLLLVLAAGQYEDDVPRNSTWETGDWNGDGEFTSADLVAVFQRGLFVTDDEAG